MSTTAVRLRRWTRAEYEQMVEAGIFGPDDRIELLDGEIVEVTPQGFPHAGVIHLVADALKGVLARDHSIRIQVPVALDEASEPEPDVAVVRGGPRDYLERHPASPVLLVEVSESSLAHDRGPKLRAYARNGVPEYWIVNLGEERLEVYRQPQGEAYASTQVLGRGDRVEPLFVPISIAVADLLP